MWRMMLEFELEQHIQEYDTNEDKKITINEKISKANREQEFFVSLFPRSEIQNIKILDYVLGKSDGKDKTFSYLIEYGSTTFGKIGGGSARHFVVYYSPGEKKFVYHESFKSHTEAYEKTIKLIDQCVNEAKNAVESKDWAVFDFHITQLIEFQEATPPIAVISKIIAMYFPNEFIRIWSHRWLNNALDAFQIKREQLREGEKESNFYRKMEQLIKFKNSHPIMQKWSNEYFSYSISAYLKSKIEIEQKSLLLNFLKLKMNMKQNYQPIVIKMLLESPNHSTSVKDIRKKFGELNFERGNFVSSTGKSMGNSAIDTVGKALKKFVKFPDGTSDGIVTLIEKTYDESYKNECLKICGQKIAKWHIEKNAKEGFRIWGIQPGRRSSDYEYLDEFLETNSIGCGWNKFGDLSRFQQKSDADEFVRKSYPENNGQTATAFSHDLKKKDVIVLTKGQSEIIDFGIVVSNYQYQPRAEEKSYSHRRRVVWLNRGSIKKEELQDGLMSGMISTINSMRNPESIDSMINILLEEDIVRKKDLTSKEDELDTVSMDNYERALKWKPNLILYGPPGTGKTYHANKIAEKIQKGNVFPDFFMLKGPWVNWKQNLSGDNPTWATTDAQSNLNQYNLMKVGDYVILQNNNDDLGPYDDVGYFGVGKITKLFDSTEPFFEDEIKVGKIIWKKRLDFEVIKIVDNKAMILRMNGLPYTKGLSSISNSDNIEKIVYEIKSKWGINLHTHSQSRKFVTFHPSYSYEDFVEGFRPNVDGEDEKPYVLEDGIFQQICNTAKDDLDSKNQYVIIIDEINRGNIPKILGELITLIEKDKRNPENSLQLTYSKNDFFVPENLIIIGTMNTADKSLMQMDDALKRRFVFEELMPDTELLENQLREENKVTNASDYSSILKRINEKILGKGNEDEKERMKQFRDRQIGHSYFWNIGKEGNPDDDLQKIIKYDVIPLLQDYFYGDYAEIRKILSKKNDKKDVSIINSDNRPTNLVTDVSQKENLRKALKEI
jgi:5-methylcytosine-specific restriction enzyme B